MVLITIVTGAFVNQQTSLGASHCRTVGHLEIERNLERFQTFGVFYYHLPPRNYLGSSQTAGLPLTHDHQPLITINH